MSWHVEHADPLAVLRELPDGWAQTCVTSPPRRLPDDRVLAVLGEVHRVLRTDGTLWLLHSPQALPAALEEHGWRAASPVPSWYSAARARWRGPAVAHQAAAVLLRGRRDSRVRPPATARLPSERGGCGEACTWQDSRELHLRLRRLCVLAASAPVACGACGTPWRRAPNGGARRPGCAHNDPRGRCLILDPFCRSSDTALLASRYGRSFLGITEPQGMSSDRPARRVCGTGRSPSASATRTARRRRAADRHHDLLALASPTPTRRAGRRAAPRLAPRVPPGPPPQDGGAPRESRSHRAAARARAAFLGATSRTSTGTRPPAR